MVAGGSESCIHPLAMAGFAWSRSLSTAFNESPVAASRPFDAQRDGFVMSEGCGIVMLEELEHTKAPSAQIYAELVGYGVSADAHHVTAPNGDVAMRAMRMALREAQAYPGIFDYVNAYATIRCWTIGPRML